MNKKYKPLSSLVSGRLADTLPDADMTILGLEQSEKKEPKPVMTGSKNLGTFYNKYDFMPDYVADPLPTALIKVQRERQFVADMGRKTLNALIGELPDENTDIYILSNGNGAERFDGSDLGTFDFGTFIPYLAEMVGATDLYISTWTMNMRGADTIANLLDTGTISKLTVVTDPYFNRREKDISARLLLAMGDNDAANYVAFRNHAKIICAGNPQTGRYATISGSANLSSQPRVEQFILSASPDVYRFFVDNLFEWAVGKSKKAIRAIKEESHTD